jgi:hypothetical protein
MWAVIPKPQANNAATIPNPVVRVSRFLASAFNALAPVRALTGSAASTPLVPQHRAVRSQHPAESAGIAMVWAVRANRHWLCLRNRSAPGTFGRTTPVHRFLTP